METLWQEKRKKFCVKNVTVDKMGIISESGVLFMKGQQYLLRNKNGLWLSIDFMNQKYFFSKSKNYAYIAANEESAKKIAKEYDCTLVVY